MRRACRFSTRGLVSFSIVGVSRDSTVEVGLAREETILVICEVGATYRRSRCAREGGRLEHAELLGEPIVAYVAFTVCNGRCAVVIVGNSSQLDAIGMLRRDSSTIIVISIGRKATTVLVNNTRQGVRERIVLVNILTRFTIRVGN